MKFRQASGPCCKVSVISPFLMSLVPIFQNLLNLTIKGLQKLEFPNESTRSISGTKDTNPIKNTKGRKKTTKKRGIVNTARITCCKSGFCCCAENCFGFPPPRGAMPRILLGPCCCTCCNRCKNFSLWSGAISVLPRNCPWKCKWKTPNWWQ